jgi:hypothetical protein
MEEIDHHSPPDSNVEKGMEASAPLQPDDTSIPDNDEINTSLYLKSAIELGHYVSNYAMSMTSMVSFYSATSTTSEHEDAGVARDGSTPTQEVLELTLQPHDESTSSSFEFPFSSSLPIPNALAQPTVPSGKSPLVGLWDGDTWILVKVPILLSMVYIFCYLYYNRRTRQQRKQPKDPQTTLSSFPQLNSSPRRPDLTTMDHRSSRRLSSPDRLSRVNPSMASARSVIGGSSSRNLPPRSRSSTFDFFGMNDGIGEEPSISRSNSLTRLGRGGNGNGGAGGGGPRRKRTGSIDLLLQGLGVVTGGVGGNYKNNIKRKLSFEEGNHSNRMYRFDSGGGGDEDGMLYDEFGPITFSSQLVYHGPGCSTISYSTWTPPTTVSQKRSRKEGGGMAPPLPTIKNHGRLLASDVILKLRRTVILDIHKSSLSFVVPNRTTASSSSSLTSKKFDFALPVPKFSTHVVPPALGGVLNVYVLGSPKDEWMEYTFDSAQQAAQFQLDLIAYQVLGNTLRNMYQVLSLVHQGSEAHDGQEFVLHDDQQIHDNKSKEGDTTVSQKENNADTDGGASAAKTDKPTFINAGVAWDDALRALSSIPSVRIALERLWLHHRNHGFPATTPTSGAGTGDAATTTTASGAAGKKSRGSKSKTNKNQAVGGTASSTTLETSAASPSLDIHQASLTEEYVNKRLLLGPVDFFRLFVPTLPETAIPVIDESNKDRMEQLLRWRKRVARGAVLVRSYVISHKVVNEGWRLPRPVSFPMHANLQPFRKRLAYDDNEDNNRRDFTARNEYYEATVSRDVLCHVRPDDYFFQDDMNNNSNSKIHTQWKFPYFSGGNQFFSQRHLVLSPCQAYSLVAAHIFQLPNQYHSHPLQASNDPVAVIPSLFDLISKHPEVDFLISSFYPEARSIAVVACYVRSLPKGIDPAFDTVVRFVMKSKRQ